MIINNANFNINDAGDVIEFWFRFTRFDMILN